MKRQKIKTMTARCQKTRKRIILSSEEEENYESDIGDETDLDQVGNN